MTDDMIDDAFLEDDSPQDIQWATNSAEEPTFPEGAWTHKSALVEGPLEGQKYQVKFEGVYWTATATSPQMQLVPGDTVDVLGRDGNELIVQKRPTSQPDSDLPEPLFVDPTQAPLPGPMI